MPPTLIQVATTRIAKEAVAWVNVRRSQAQPLFAESYVEGAQMYSMPLRLTQEEIRDIINWEEGVRPTMNPVKLHRALLHFAETVKDRMFCDLTETIPWDANSAYAIVYDVKLGVCVRVLHRMRPISYKSGDPEDWVVEAVGI
jgi:hypothetical protein